MSEVITYTAGVRLNGTTNTKREDATTLYVLDLELEHPFTDSAFGGDVYSMAKERIEAMGFEPNSYRLLGVLRGKYTSTEEFLEELDKAYYEETYYIEQEEEAELERQREWEEYVNENYDFTAGDWRY